MAVFNNQTICPVAGCTTTLAAAKAAGTLVSMKVRGHGRVYFCSREHAEEFYEERMEEHRQEVDRNEIDRALGVTKANPPKNPFGHIGNKDPQAFEDVNVNPVPPNLPPKEKEQKAPSIPRSVGLFGRRRPRYMGYGGSYTGYLISLGIQNWKSILGTGQENQEEEQTQARRPSPPPPPSGGRSSQGGSPTPPPPPSPPSSPQPHQPPPRSPIIGQGIHGSEVTKVEIVAPLPIPVTIVDDGTRLSGGVQPPTNPEGPKKPKQSRQRRPRQPKEAKKPAYLEPSRINSGPEDSEITDAEFTILRKPMGLLQSPEMSPYGRQPNTPPLLPPPAPFGTKAPSIASVGHVDMPGEGAGDSILHGAADLLMRAAQSIDKSAEKLTKSIENLAGQKPPGNIGQTAGSFAASQQQSVPGTNIAVSGQNRFRSVLPASGLTALPTIDQAIRTALGARIR